jgi:hypothetical protein
VAALSIAVMGQAQLPRNYRETCGIEWILKTPEPLRRKIGTGAEAKSDQP